MLIRRFLRLSICAVKLNMQIENFERSLNSPFQTGPIHVAELSAADGSELKVLIERVETVERSQNQQGIIEARLRINYLLLESHALSTHSSRSRGGYFSAHYWSGIDGHGLNDKEGGICLTGVRGYGAVFLDPEALRGLSLGTYIMDMIVAWAHQWPDAWIQTIKLEPGQSEDSNRERRNRFYEQFNIRFHYVDELGRSGASVKMRAGELVRPINAWRGKVSPVSMNAYLSSMLDQQKKLEFQNMELAHSNKFMRQSLAEQHRHPFRYAFQVLWWRCQDLLLLSGLASCIGLAFYFRS